MRQGFCLQGAYSLVRKFPITDNHRPMSVLYAFFLIHVVIPDIRQMSAFNFQCI